MWQLLPHIVDKAAARFGERTAIRFKDRSLSYEQLLYQSNSLANYLIHNGTNKGDRVGILMNKCLEAPIAIYGIMKSGAAYVPLNASAPAEYLAMVIQDCGIKTLISHEPKRRVLKELLSLDAGLENLIGVQFPDEDIHDMSWGEALRAPGDAGPETGAVEQDLAYIIYTSGSTGVPKGIMHSHDSALSFINWAMSAFQFNETDRFTNHAPLHFDMSTFDFFMATASGGCTVVVPEAHMKLPASYAQLIAKERITVFYTVPFALSQLLLRGALERNDMSALRWIIFGGDTSSTRHIRDWMLLVPQTKFCHMYGPAETNGCTYHIMDEIPADLDSAIPIGRANENMDSLVVDTRNNEIGAGESGELLVAGPAMMLGYWNRPELTEKSLYRTQDSTNLEKVYYKTGDLVEILPDGSYRFSGRKDRQIKIRGYRVELDEIEILLTSHPQVEEAAVIAVSTDEASHSILAYVITGEHDVVTSGVLKTFLSRHLPSYALPAEIKQVDVLPRTSTGKIDRLELKRKVEMAQNENSLKT